MTRMTSHLPQTLYRQTVRLLIGATLAVKTMTAIEEITELLQGLSAAGLEEVRAFVASLKSRETTPTTAWRYNFLEHFGEATINASRDPGGMEIKFADATCGQVTRSALWEHPPVSGSVSVGYLVPIPTGVRDLKVKFAIGIRDGSELPSDRMIAFRVLVNGWKLWSTIKNSHMWDEHEIKMPQLGSDVARIEFVTDGMGDNRWNWAV
jgi:hypothetical protein